MSEKGINTDDLKKLENSLLKKDVKGVNTESLIKSIKQKKDSEYVTKQRND